MLRTPDNNGFVFLFALPVYGATWLTQHVQALLKETEKLLEKWKHPDPHCFPTAPGGELHPLLDGLQS